MSVNNETVSQLKKAIEIFVSSEGEIRPHSILTGPSGSGKTHLLSILAEMFELNTLEINAASLTKEGTSGNSLSKALSPLLNVNGLTLVVVDEFDKLFISGNSNSSLAHETTNGVQNEFLKVLESSHAQVYGDFGKYIAAPVDKCLFIFLGAFNGEEDISIDRLREFGIKTEFLGRVGLVYSLQPLTLEELKNILQDSILLNNYLTLFPDAKKAKVVSAIMAAVEENYVKNTLGVRMLNNLIHSYFIQGGLTKASIERKTFQKTLSMG